MAAEIPYDLLGLIFGILGLVGLLPLLWASVTCRLPQYRLQQLDATLDETSALLENAIKDGFLPSTDFVLEMRHSLHILRRHTEGLRANVVCAHGIRQQCAAAMNGLSRQVDDVCQRVTKLRIQVATESEKERRRAAELALQASSDGLSATPSTGLTQDVDASHNRTNHKNGYDLDYHRPIYETMDALVPSLPTPPPIYTPRTRNLQYQPIRSNSLTDSVSSDSSVDVSSMSTLPSWSVQYAPSEQAPPLYQSFPATAVPTGYGPASDTNIQHPQPEVSLAHVRDPLLPTDASVMVLIANLKEQISILEGLHLNIAFSVQDAVERALHDRLRTHSPLIDAEAGGLRSESPQLVPHH